MSIKQSPGRWGVQYRAKGSTGWLFERCVFHGCQTEEEARNRYERWLEKHQGPRTAENRLIYRPAGDFKNYEVLATRGLPQ